MWRLWIYLVAVLVAFMPIVLGSIVNDALVDYIVSVTPFATPDIIGTAGLVVEMAVGIYFACGLLRSRMWAVNVSIVLLALGTSLFLLLFLVALVAEVRSGYPEVGAALSISSLVYLSLPQIRKRIREHRKQLDTDEHMKFINHRWLRTSTDNLSRRIRLFIAIILFILIIILYQIIIT